MIINALFQQLVAKNNIILISEMLILSKIKSKDNNIFSNKILLAILINIPYNLISSLSHGYRLALSPFLYSNATNPHTRIQIQNFLILKKLIIHDNKSC